MPAVSVSSQLSQGVYFVAVVVLSILLARPVYLVYSASQDRAAETVASGTASMLDSMSPGMSVVASLESYPGVEISVSLSGTTVTAYCGSATATATVVWDLPRTTVSAGEAYNFTLTGRAISVGQTRHG